MLFPGCLKISNANRVQDNTIRKLDKNLLTETSDGLMKSWVVLHSWLTSEPFPGMLHTFSMVECNENPIGSDMYSLGTYKTAKMRARIPMSAQFDGFLKYVVGAVIS